MEIDLTKIPYSTQKEIGCRNLCSVWVKENKIRNEKGDLLEFKDRAFLEDIYDDWTPVQTARKASQIGFSVMKILKSFWGAKHRNLNIIYTLPTFSDVGQFVPSKVNALISQNPILAEWTQDKDTITQKKIGNSFIYYRGTVAKGKEAEEMMGGVGIMFSSDLNVHDEADRSSQAVLEQYESRLEASSYKGRWYFSNPTSPNTKSQDVWAISDQKHWFIKCGNGHWQYLDYFKHIKAGKFICEKCGKEITDEDRRNGQWVKKYPSRSDTASGYWISHLIAPWISAKEIENSYNTKTRQYFYNFILGLPYVGSDIIVNRDIVLRAISRDINFKQGNVIGVDQGLKKHYVLGNRQGIFRVGVVDSWEEIEELMRIYDVETAVFDALPDLTEPRKLRDKYPGIVWLNYFKKEIKKADFITWDYKTHTCYSDRSKIIQQVIDEMVDRKIRFSMEPEDLKDYIQHWQALHKEQEEDVLGIARDVWITSGDDHYCFATIYFRLALDKAGSGEIKIIDPQGGGREPRTDLAPDIQKILNNNLSGGTA